MLNSSPHMPTIMSTLDSRSSALTSFTGSSGCRPQQSATLAHPTDCDYNPYSEADDTGNGVGDGGVVTTGDFLNELGLGRETEEDDVDDSDGAIAISTNPSATIPLSPPYVAAASLSPGRGGAPFIINAAVTEAGDREYEDRCLRILRDRVNAIKKKGLGGNVTTGAYATISSVGVGGSSLVDRYRWCCENVRSWCNDSVLGLTTPPSLNSSRGKAEDISDSQLDGMWRGDAFDTSSWGRDLKKNVKKKNGVPGQLAVLSQVVKNLEVRRTLPLGSGISGHNNQPPPPFQYPFFLADDEGTLSLNSVSIDDEIATQDNILSIPPVCNRRGILPLLVTLLTPFPVSSSCSTLTSNIVRLDLSSSEVDDLVVRLLTHGVYSSTTTAAVQIAAAAAPLPRSKEVVATRGLLSTLSNLVEIDLSYNPLISYEGGQWLQGYIIGGVVSTRANTNKKNAPTKTKITSSPTAANDGGCTVPYYPTSLFSPSYDLTTATTYNPNPYLASVVLDGCDGIRKGTLRAIRSALLSRSVAIASSK